MLQAMLDVVTCEMEKELKSRGHKNAVSASTFRSQFTAHLGRLAQSALNTLFALVLPLQTGNPEPRSPLADRLVAWACFPLALGLLCLGGVYAYSITFSLFNPYDDQGYIMMSVRGFLGGYPLYTDVYSNFGPFFYAYQWTLHALCSIPLTHDTTGLLCVLHWLIAALVLALAGRRMTNSTWVAFLVFAQGMVHLRNLAGEPGHPQELVCVLLALTAFVVARGPRPSLLLLGAISGALLLTKVNVGGLYIIALLQTLAFSAVPFRASRIVLVAVLGLTALVPVVLMRPLLGQRWALDYCWQATATVLAAGLVACAFANAHRVTPAQVIRIAVGFFSAFLVSVGPLFLSGTSLSALLDCLVTAPAKFATMYCVPLLSSSIPSATLSLVAAAVAVLMRQRLKIAPLVIAAAKGMYGVLGCFVLTADISGKFALLSPWCWLLLLQAETSSRRDNSSRTFLCLLSAWQLLQAFPVSGTQKAVGSVLLVLIFALCLHDCGVILREHLTLGIPLTTERMTPMLSGAAMVLVLYLFTFKWDPVFTRRHYYTSVPPLELPGTRLLRLEYHQSQRFHTITKFLERECDCFLTMPALNSLHFWTGKPAPTYLNNCGELALLSPRQEHVVIEALQKAKRPLILLDQRVTRFSITGNCAPGGPLARYIQNQYSEVTEVAGFLILAPVAGGVGREALSATANVRASSAISPRMPEDPAGKTDRQ
jgi:hypothetical protein